MNHPAAISQSAVASSWNARLELGLAQTTRGTRLLTNRHSGPLYVQKPFYPEGPDLPHIYLLHPPGGLVSGDSLTVDVNIATDAGALFTTPGAGRCYRARQDATPQCQHINLSLGQGASVEWLPQETILFPGANAHLDTRIDLAAAATVCFWDVVSLGLPAMKQTFDRGHFKQRLTIFHQGRPLLVDRLDVDGCALSEGPRDLLALRDNPVVGFFVAGPFASTDQPEQLLQRLRQSAGEYVGIAGLTFNGGFVIGRCLGDCSASTRQLLHGWWQHARPELLARPALAPGIWAT